MLVYLRDGSAQTILRAAQTILRAATDQTFYLTQSQYTDTADQSQQGSNWAANF